MNRRGFLKAFAGTSVAAVAAPMLLLEGVKAASVAAAADPVAWYPIPDAPDAYVDAEGYVSYSMRVSEWSDKVTKIWRDGNLVMSRPNL